MCGIAGLVDKRGRFGREALGALAQTMAARFAYRGPDDEGLWVSPDGRVALAQRRLAIIDTSADGHQPMVSADGRRVIAFNGEIYNFLELRAELEAAGETFRTRTDTEVLMRVLERKGHAGLDDLDAMFAFAWFDAANGALLLGRDIFGEKPLYYVDHEGYFAFASELHALAHLPGFDARIDGEAIARFLAYQYVPAPDTIYRSARKLAPGCWLSRDAAGRIEIQSYYRFQTSALGASPRPLPELADELEALLVTSVRRRLISDVPIGAFLSGGVDSSTVVALASKVTREPVRTFTIGFEGFPESEHLESAEAARLLGARHQERMLRPDGVALCAEIGRMLDEPNADSSCLPTFLLSKFAREQVTVALSGDGGDEMFGGYGRYFATVDEEARKARAGGMDWWSPGLAYWSSRILVFPPEELEALVGFMPAGPADEIIAARARLDADPRPMINRLRELDAGHYMPGAVLAKVDRMSMQTSLEVRAPLIGREVAAFAMGLAADACYGEGQGKRVLKAVAARYLPEAWLNRPKRGFGLPMGLWGAESLLPAARSLLLCDDARLQAFLPRAKLSAYLDRMSRDFSAYRVWSLLVLEHWLRTHPFAVGAPMAPAMAAPAPPKRSLFQAVKRALRA